ncbi:hypothetical protein E8E14_008678 [Neopestalotiopsis sp. 37M]|nr:hypothetical protein E8E14_008678 [Neopestalotiopsis sp. 37M]
MPPHARPRLSTEIESNGASSKPRGSRKPSPLSSTSVPIILPDLNRQKPSKMAQREHGANRLPADADDHSIRERFGFKRNYNGDVTNPANRPQEVSKELNCNLWITGLPADCTESDVEAAIGKAGAIFSINLNRPDHAIGHATTAAQVAFMRVESARAFLNDKRKTGLLVRGFVAKVGWNRNRVGPQNEINSMGKLRSRVLVIQGAPSMVNEVSLSHLFRRYFTFFTTSVKTVAEEEDRTRTMEWRFARVAGQADLAAKCLQELIDDGYDIKYRFAKDPCEVDIVSSLPHQCSETPLTDMPSQSARASSHLCPTCDDPDDNEGVIVHCPISSKYMSTAVQGELLVPHMLLKNSRRNMCHVDD